MKTETIAQTTLSTAQEIRAANIDAYARCANPASLPTAALAPDIASAFSVNDSAQPASHAGMRILAQGHFVSNDTRSTGLNNNDLIVGPTGSGKTRGYVKPNLLQMCESAIVTDTKGSLRHEIGPVLEQAGYRVIDFDFTNVAESSGYNPLDFVRANPHTGAPFEQDILKIAAALVPTEDRDDPFWDHAARNLLGCYLGFILEFVDPRERTLDRAARMLANSSSDPKTRESSITTETILDRFAQEHPDSFAARKWRAFKPTTGAERMYASVLGILSEKLDPLTFDGVAQMYARPERINFRELGQRKTVVFLTVSDTDRSLDRLISLFYTQALQELCDFADSECPGATLPVPVRLYLDDFATNCRIADFDKTISTIRSRNIAVSVVLQSITQLETLYAHADAMTIVNGCDHLLYLGGQDVETAEFIAKKACKTVESILDVPVSDAWLFERGTRARQVRRFDLESHPLYEQLQALERQSARQARRLELESDPLLGRVDALEHQPTRQAHRLGPEGRPLHGQTDALGRQPASLSMSQFVASRQRQTEIDNEPEIAQRHAAGNTKPYAAPVTVAARAGAGHGLSSISDGHGAAFAPDVHSVSCSPDGHGAGCCIGLDRDGHGAAFAPDGRGAGWSPDGHGAGWSPDGHGAGCCIGLDRDGHGAAFAPDAHSAGWSLGTCSDSPTDRWFSLEEAFDADDAVKLDIAPGSHPSTSQAGAVASHVADNSIASNELYAGHINEMLQVMNHIATRTSPAGPSYNHDLLNPAIVFTKRVKRGDMDHLDDAEYAEALRACERLSLLWEGERLADGLTVARNALVAAVLSDDALRPVALSAVHELFA